jgi:hypothetical protein
LIDANVKTAVIIIGQNSDASLSLASRALSDVFDRVEVATLGDPAESIEDAAGRCAEEVDRIIVLPYTLELSESELGSLEAAVERLQKIRPDRDVRLSPHVGFDTRLVDILGDRIAAAANESSADDNVPIITVESQGQKTRGFTLSDLLALPNRLDDIGRLVPNRSGEAVSVEALLSAVGLTGSETKATFESGEDFSADVDLKIAREHGWLVFRLDKKPLPARYGGPVRLFIPGLDDRCSNVKSVDRLIIK